MANSWKFMFATKKANSADHHLNKICGRFVSKTLAFVSKSLFLQSDSNYRTL
jgi:hypothetical protein